MGSPFAPNAVPAPVLQRRCPARSQKVWGHGAVSRSDGLWRIQGTVWRKPGAVRTLHPTSFKHKNNTLKLYNQQLKTNFGRLNNYIRFYLWKRKIPPTQRSDDFVGWNGGKIDRVCCGAVDLLGMIHGEAVFKMNTTTSCGWLQANPQKQRDLWQRISRIERCVKIIWKKLLRQSGDSRTYRRLLELFFLFTATMIAIEGLWLVRAEKGFHNLLQRIMSSTLPVSSKDDLMGV